MRTADVCPTCATYTNACCVIYDGPLLETLNIATSDPVCIALEKIELWASGIGGIQGVDQDNVFTQYYPNNIQTNNAEPTISEVRDAINATPSFTVSQTQLALMIVRFEQTNTFSEVVGIDYKTKYYFLKGVGKGVYGSGATQITNNNLFFLKNSYETSVTTSEDNPPVSYSIRVTEEGILDTPWIALNNDAGSYPVIANTDYYFKIYLADNANEKAATDDQGSYKLYRFSGALGTYGAGGVDSSNSGDFFLIEDQSEAGAVPTSSGIKIVDYVLKDVITGGTDISSIVNGQGEIIVDDDVLMSFQLQRYEQKSFDNSLTLVTDKYFWKNGSGIINGDTVIADFVLYETTGGTTTQTTIPAPPEVESVTAVSLDTPEIAVNESGQSYNIDGSADWYFYVFYKNSRREDKPDSSDFKTYRFVGALGTYGFGGLTAVNGDFLLVADGGETIPANGEQELYYEKGTRASGNSTVSIGDWDGSGNHTYFSSTDSNGRGTMYGTALRMANQNGLSGSGLHEDYIGIKGKTTGAADDYWVTINEAAVTVSPAMVGAQPQGVFKWADLGAGGSETIVMSVNNINADDFGNVDLNVMHISGTPVAGQIATFTDADTVEGVPGATFDGINMEITGVIQSAVAEYLQGVETVSVQPVAGLTGTHIQQLPDKSGTFAMLDDIALGGGDVTKVGTPANTEMAWWSGDGTLSRNNNFTYNGTSELYLAHTALVGFTLENTTNSDYSLISTKEVTVENGINGSFVSVFDNQVSFGDGTFNLALAADTLTGNVSLTLPPTTGTLALATDIAVDSVTFVGTNGSSTLIGGVLNIPGYFKVSEFETDVFRIKDNVTPTKEISFNASLITAGNTRVITMPDTDVELDKIQEFNEVVKTTRVSLSNAQMMALGVTPVELVAAQGGAKALRLISATIEVTPNVTAFDFPAGELQVRTGTTNQVITVGSAINCNSAGTEARELDKQQGVSGALVPKNESFELFSENGNPTVGDGTAVVIVVYVVADFSI